MTTAARDFKIISADAHFTEPANLWVDHIATKYRDRAPRVERRDGVDVWTWDTGDMFPVSSLHGVRYNDKVRPDGAFYAQIPASGWDPDARIPDMERDGIYAEVLYPSVAMRAFTFRDAAFGEACAEAYNTWAAEFCKKHPERFKAIGLSFLDDIEHAVVELHRMKKLGLGGAMIAVPPEDSQPYHDPRYEPYWAAAVELGLPISLHVFTERRVKPASSPAKRFLAYTAVQEVLIGMIYAGTLDKFPKLQLVSAENDAGWAGNLIERMDFFHGESRNRRSQGNQELPSHYWHTNVNYTFMRDLTAMASRHIIGVDRLMWSSDFPHGDSTWPNSQKVVDRHMEGVPANEQRMILRENARRLYGFK